MTRSAVTEAGISALTPRSTPVDWTGLDVPASHAFVCDIAIARSGVSNVVDHVSNIEYVRWLDRAAELHADSLGYTRAWLVNHGMMWFVARHEIDYLAEALPHDHLVIGTWVRSIRKVKSWRDYAIVRPADQTMICRAATLWVLVDLESRRPKRISAEMIARFQSVPDSTDAAQASSPLPHAHRPHH